MEKINTGNKRRIWKFKATVTWIFSTVWKFMLYLDLRCTRAPLKLSKLIIKHVFYPYISK